MTNEIKIGDWVHIGGTWITGKVVEIDDHPLQYARICIEFKDPTGVVKVWESVRMAKVIHPDADGLVSMRDVLP